MSTDSAPVTIHPNEEKNDSKKEESEPDESEEKKEKGEKVSLCQLFRFATTMECIMSLIATLCAVCLGAVWPAWSYLMGLLMDRVFNPESNVAAKGLRDLGIMYGIIGAGLGVAGFLSKTFYSYIGKKIVVRIRQKFLKSLLRQDIAWYDMQKTESVITRLTADSLKIETALTVKLGEAIEFLSTAAIGLPLAFYLNWELTLVVMGCGPVVMCFGGYFGMLLGKVTKEQDEEYAKAGFIVEETLSNIRTVMSFNGQGKAVEAYGENLKAAESHAIRFGNSFGIFMLVFNMLVYSAMGVAFWYGGLMLTRTGSTLTPGEVFAAFMLFIMGVMMMGQAGSGITAVINAQTAAFGLYQLIDRKPPIDIFAETGIKSPKNKRGIEFRDVFFRYPSRPEQPILNGISFIVNEGQSIALVGESGSGKSTCIGLVQRFYDVEKGQVLVDGTDVKELNLRWLRAKIGLVSQEPILFNTTIANNIWYGRGYGKDDATLDETKKDEIRKAARGANIDSFIEDQPDGYDTNVGEAGTQLSGGQKQRIAIARALIRDPSILLLDEATSALDVESERIVQEALDQLIKGRTTIVIAHRLSTIRDCDAILVFDKGEICERGNHTELIQKLDGAYRMLVEKQEIKKEDADEKEDELPGIMVRQQSSEIGVTKEHAIEEEESEDVPSSRIFGLIRPEYWIIGVGLISSALYGIVMPIFSVVLTDTIKILSGCLPIPVINAEATVFFYGEFTDINECHSDLRTKTIYVLIAYASMGTYLGLTFYVMTYAFSVVGSRLTKRLRYFSFKGIMRQEIGWFDLAHNSTGILTARLSTDTATINALVTTALSIYLQNIVCIVLAISLSLYYNWPMTLLVLGCAPFIGLGSFIDTRYQMSLHDSDKGLHNKAGAIIFEAFKGIRTVSAFSMEENIIAMYDDVLRDVVSRAKKSAFVGGLAFGYTKFSALFFFLPMMYFGAYLVEEGLYTADEIMKGIMTMIFAAMGASQASAMAGDVKKAKLNVPKIFCFIDSLPKTVDVGPIVTSKDANILPPIVLAKSASVKSNEQKVDIGTKLASVKGAIEIKDIFFKYPSRPGIPILRGVSISILPGQTVALVGSSGSGKSTIISLLERFYDPLSGTITLDGVDITTIDVNSLRTYLGLVGQEPILFAASLLDNIRYGKDNATIEEVQEAARGANIADFIEGLVDKYDTFAGAKGCQLSGGQKQRIAIARALIRNPPILLLDEATAALDSKSEQVVQRALTQLMVGRTTIVVAHRLSTIQDADQIIVMGKGKVREQGKHQELLKQRGIYYNLCQQQKLGL